MICAMPASLDLVFKVRRKKFTIELLHLPPDLSETVSRSREEAVDAVSSSKSSHGHSHSHSKDQKSTSKTSKGKSSSQIGCGSKTPDGKSLLDF